MDQRVIVRCAQPECASLPPIGEVWHDAAERYHPWKATSVERPPQHGREHVQLHDHPLEAAHWTRGQHDVFRHEYPRSAEHEKRGDAADVAVARLFINPDGTPGPLGAQQ